MNIIDGPISADTEPTDFVLDVLTPLLGPAAAESTCDALFKALEAAGWSIGPSATAPDTVADHTALSYRALIGYQFGRGGFSIARDDDDPTGGASWEIIPPEHAEAWRMQAEAMGSDCELMPIHEGNIEDSEFIGPPGAQ